MDLIPYKPILSTKKYKKKLPPELLQNHSVNVIIRSPNWLGDAIMILPALYQIKKTLPNESKIHIVCQEKLRILWEAVPWIDNVFAFPGKRLNKQNIKKLKKIPNVISFIFPNSFGAAMDFYRCAFPVRIGRAGGLRSWMLTHQLPPKVKCKNNGYAQYHQTSEYLEIVSVLCENSTSFDYPPIKANIDAEKIAGMDICGLRKKKILIIAPGTAYGPAKQWNVEKFAKIAQYWEEKYNGTVIAVGTEKEKEIADSAISLCQNAVNTAGKTSLAELIFLIEICDICLANDSGVMHLAAACNCHGVAIFGSTDPIATGPIGGKWIILHEDVDCAPCFERTCRKSSEKYSCLESISVENAIDAIDFL
ncbi:MAG: lipopolysaccharide heptosyltransferase II [Verrucomicrobiota bacterium]|nr:lipopolysaccharide heptosyltransferase II [Verrucomicrobiota bacterium]